MMIPIRDVITEISGDTYPTGSMNIPIVHCLKQKISCIHSETNWSKFEREYSSNYGSTISKLRTISIIIDKH